MVSDKRLYDELVDITEDYLGPAAKRFIDRQTRNHLNKEPGELTNAELVKLADWVKLTLALLTKDTRIKSEYAKKLDNLMRTNVIL